MTPTQFCVRKLGQFLSVVAANGSGKTDRLVAPLVIWFLDQTSFD